MSVPPSEFDPGKLNFPALGLQMLQLVQDTTKDLLKIERLTGHCTCVKILLLYLHQGYLAKIQLARQSDLVHFQATIL